MARNVSYHLSKCMWRVPLPVDGYTHQRPEVPIAPGPRARPRTADALVSWGEAFTKSFQTGSATVCSYCGCEAESVIAELMADHADIALRVDKVNAALAVGDRDAAMTICAEIAALFSAHTRKEEAGLFAELQLDTLATSTIGELEAEHRQLEESLAKAAAGAAAAEDVFLALESLLDHANREDTDVFPVALQVLPDAAWDRVKDVMGRADRAGAR